jgi:iron(III) transport system substrate-binding protein
MTAAKLFHQFLVVPLFYFFLFTFAFAAPAADWKSEWEKTVAAAKKEGQVTVYISGYDAVVPAFQKEYPEIKVVLVAAPGVQLGQRVMAEQRAGKHLVDVVSAGANPNFQSFYRAKILQPIRPALILPEVLDESKWWEGKHKYGEPDGQYVFVYEGTATNGGISYNNRLVRPAEFKSYWNLLDSKFKGKIVSRDPRDPGPSSGPLRLFYYHPEIGPKFIERIYREMEVTLTRDFRQPVDWLAQGKFLICLFCNEIPAANRQGLPVDTLRSFKEGAGLISRFGTLAFMNNAPHPNAARVFINWYLSRRGQVALQQSIAKAGLVVPDSLRTDIPKDDVAPEDRRMAGVHYVDTDLPERIDMRPIHKIINEALAESGKK